MEDGGGGERGLDGQGCCVRIVARSRYILLLLSLLLVNLRCYMTLCPRLARDELHIEIVEEKAIAI